MVIVGALIVILSVIGGYTMHGGHMGILVQPTELLIIGGAGVGSLVISAPTSLIKEIFHQVMGTLKAKDPTEAEYTELLMLLFELCKVAKANPLSLEPHVEKPESSDIFKRYPNVLADHHVVHFIADTLKVQISAPMNPYDLEALMDQDIQSAHSFELAAPAAVSKLGDAMPGLGIVAAVLGVVITMGKLTQGKEVIGHSVAAALVGTFLGILLSYGFMGPLSGKMEAMIGNTGRKLEVVKASLIALAKDCSPKVCVEFGRRTVPPFCRPSFEALDKATSNAGKAA